MSKEYISEVLKRLRLKSGLTADEVGKLVGKSGKTVNGWENSRSQPDAEIFLKLCDIYNVDDILYEFKEIINEVKKIKFNLTPHEKNVIIAYRNKKGMQAAVDRLLGIEAETIPSLTAARSNNNEPIQIENVPDLSKFEPDDSDL